MQNWKKVYWLWGILTVTKAMGQVLPATHYKHLVTKEVCQRIAAAYRSPLIGPRLEIHEKPGRIARFDIEPGGILTLRFDERLYDLCQSYGSDSLHALACLIGHEMAHFYQQQGFIPAYGQSSGLAAESSEARSRLEAEADRFGLYYGYLAGYDTYRLLPTVLRAVYQDYRLGQKLRGYPSLTQRMVIVEEERERFRPLATAFEAGHFLWLLHQNEEAAVCFQHLLNHFQSKEVYNNLGVIRLTQALQAMPAQAVPYAYPFEWDAGNRLRMGALRGGASDQKRADVYLQQARVYFKAALQLDPAYATAAVNLACTYSLLNNQEGCISTIRELEDIYQEQKMRVPGNAFLIKGIAYARNKQPDRASPCFDQAVRQQAFRAAYNREVFEKTVPKNQLANLLPNWEDIEQWIRETWLGMAPDPKPQPLPREDAIGPVRFGHWLTSSSSLDTLYLPHPTHPVHVILRANPYVYATRLLINGQQIDVIAATSAYRGTTRAGMRVGNPVSRLHQLYGLPDAELPATGQRQFLHYKQLAMIVEVQHNRIRGWQLYRF